MGSTLLDFHQGPSDDEKDKLGLVEMANYLSEFSETKICADELEEKFFSPWQSFITPRRKEFLEEYPIEDFLSPFLKQKGIRLEKYQLIEALDKQSLHYRKYLAMEQDLAKTLTTLKDSGIKLGVISNSCNYDEINLAHFEYMGIKDFFDSFTFSYYLRIRKPRREIFESALKALSAKPETSLMVGDSLEADVKGASFLGMKTAWYNPERKTIKTNIKSDCEIFSLRELTSLYL